MTTEIEVLLKRIHETADELNIAAGEASLLIEEVDAALKSYGVGMWVEGPAVPHGDFENDRKILGYAKFENHGWHIGLFPRNGESKPLSMTSRTERIAAVAVLPEFLAMVRERLIEHANEVKS